jgi:hypothetical protein
MAKFALGIALFFGVARLAPQQNFMLVGWVGMTGAAFLLHFGSFHILSCAMRSLGFAAVPLMNWPIAATSVSEFWGRRWNMAFRDLTHRFLFRPLAARIGAGWALVVGFFFSGLVHDAVISLPARGGYGGPTAFFMIQAAALFIERSRWGRVRGLGRGWTGRLFAAAVLLLPAPLLFHRPFLKEIVIPFMQACQAIP